MISPATVDIGTLITSVPGVNGGRPCIAGTGISVLQIAAMVHAGLSPEQIRTEFPHVDIASVYAAVTYYLANRQLFDTELRQEAEATTPHKRSPN